MFHSNVYCVISQICANIMEYCQTLLLQSSAEAQFSLCLFSPSASEPAGWSLWLFMSVYVDKILAGSCKLTVLFPVHRVGSDVSVPSARVPSLGLVLLLLKNSATDFFRYHDSHRQSLNKLERVEQLPPEELKEVYMQIHCCLFLPVWLTYTELSMPDISFCVQSCARVWCLVLVEWKRSHQCRETCLPSAGSSSWSTTEPNFLPSVPVS